MSGFGKATNDWMTEMEDFDLPPGSMYRSDKKRAASDMLSTGAFASHAELDLNAIPVSKAGQVELYAFKRTLALSKDRANHEFNYRFAAYANENDPNAEMLNRMERREIMESIMTAHKPARNIMPTITGRRLAIGAMFKGTCKIKEYKDDNIFIPSNGWCVLKALSHLGIEPPRKTLKKFTEEMTLRAIRRVLKDYTCPFKEKCKCGQHCSKLKEKDKNKIWSDCWGAKPEPPSTCQKCAFEVKSCKHTHCVDELTCTHRLPIFYRLSKRKGQYREGKVQWVKTQIASDEHTDFTKIVLLYDEQDEASKYKLLHTIVLKSKEMKDMVKSAKTAQKLLDIVKSKFEWGMDKTLSCKQKAGLKIKMRSMDTTNVDVFAFDCETSMGPNGIQQVEMVGYQPVDLIKYEMSAEPEIVKTFSETIEDVVKMSTKPVIQMFAHNGGKFDTVLLKGQLNSKYIKFLKELKANGSIRQLDILYNDGVVKRKIMIKDTLPFLLGSLAELGRKAGLKKGKEEFDIAGKDSQFYKDNWNKIADYCKQDVRVLSQLMIINEKEMNKFNGSMLLTTGAASHAFNLTVNCSPIEHGDVHPFSDRNSQMFSSEARYGGRVIVWKKYFKGKSNRKEDCLIALDCNSLYPAAQAQVICPIGDAKPMTIDDLKPEFIYGLLNAGKCFEVEVTMDGNNKRYPLHPHRTEENNLIYPAGRHRGVYNEICIRERLKDGYSLLEVHNGQYWNESARLQEKFINTLYNERMKSKGTPKADQLKVTLNSSYGKYAESIGSEILFSKNAMDERSVQLRNGQWQTTIDSDPLSERPVIVASRIMSTSKAIMNTLIRQVGAENVYYQDTDSIYVPYSIAEKYGYTGTDNALGAFKNDYGDKYIVEAYFIDIKRYLLIFNTVDKVTNQNEFKCKFVGLCIKNTNSACAKSLSAFEEDQTNNRIVFKDFITHEDRSLLETKSNLLEPITNFYKDLAKTYIRQDIGDISTEEREAAAENEIHAYQKKWRRDVCEVSISGDAPMSISLNFTKRCKVKDGELFPADYDFNKPENTFFKDIKTPEPAPIKGYKILRGMLISNLPMASGDGEEDVVNKLEPDQKHITPYVMSNDKLFRIAWLVDAQDKNKKWSFEPVKDGSGEKMLVQWSAYGQKLNGATEPYTKPEDYEEVISLHQDSLPVSIVMDESERNYAITTAESYIESKLKEKSTTDDFDPAVGYDDNNDYDPAADYENE